MNERYPRPIERLLGNKDRWESEATPPSDEHYPHIYLWDSGFHAMVYAHFGYPELADDEIRAVLNGQDPETGFIPNMQFGEKGRKFDPERFTFKDRKVSSDYTQPPVLAMAAKQTFDSYVENGREEEGYTFLADTFEALENSYQYFINFRQNSPDSRLIGIIHPHETGRDSDPTFDFFKKRLPRRDGRITKKPVDLLNSGLDYVSALHLNKKLQKKDWDVEHARDVFWVNDVMMNTIYADNLAYLSEISGILGKDREQRYYQSVADEVSEEIIDTMWHEDEQKFYAQKDSEPIPVVSVSNLFPIILPTIREQQAESIVAMLEDPDWFGTPYPVPTVPVNSEHYDPHYSEKRIWRGPTWINMNYLLTQGLIRQRDRFAFVNPELAMRCHDRASAIASASADLVDREGYREFYDPETGEGFRVHNFGWSTLGDIQKDHLDSLSSYALPREEVLFQTVSD